MNTHTQVLSGRMKTEGLETLLVTSHARTYINASLKAKLDVRSSSDNGQIAAGLLEHVPTLEDCVPEEERENVWWEGFGEETGDYRDFEIGGVIYQVNHSVPVHEYGEGDRKDKAFSKPLEALSVARVDIPGEFPPALGFVVIHWVYDPVSRKRYLIGKHQTKTGRGGPYKSQVRAISKRDVLHRQMNPDPGNFRKPITPIADLLQEQKLLKLATYRR